MTRDEQLDNLRALGRCPSWWRIAARRRWLRSYAAIMAFDTSRWAEFARGMYPTTMIEEMSRSRLSPSGLQNQCASGTAHAPMIGIDTEA